MPSDLVRRLASRFSGSKRGMARISFERCPTHLSATASRLVACDTPPGDGRLVIGARRFRDEEGDEGLLGLCRPPGYADLGSDGLAGLGFRSGQVGIITG